MDINRFTELLELYLADCIGDEDAKELLETIRNDPEADRLFLSNVECDFYLGQAAQGCVENSVTVLPYLADSASSEPVNRDLLKNDRRLAEPAKPLTQMTPEEEMEFWSMRERPDAATSNGRMTDEELMMVSRYESRERRIKAIAKRERRPRGFRDTVLVVALVVAAVFGFGIYRESQRKGNIDQAKVDEFLPVAKISELVEPVWSPDAVNYQRGQRIDVGKIDLKSGQVKLEFRDGATLILQAPVHFFINRAQDTFCPLGRISATVPPSASGFTIRTPLGTVVDRGTEFYVSVDRDRLEIETHKGAVDVETSDRPRTPLLRGEAIRSERNGPVRSFHFKTSRFVLPETFTGRLEQYVTRLKDEKERADLVLDADPGSLVRFDASHRTGNVVPNSSRAGRRTASELRLAGAREVEGRWYGSKAIGFDRRDSNVAFRLDGTYRRLVLTANAKFDDLGTRGNTLCAGRDFLTVPGSFAWMICQTGELMFFVTDQKGHADLFMSRPVLSAADCGAWFALSVVVDADRATITHYIDGKRVSELPWKNAIPLVPGDCMLGNMPANAVLGTGNRFNGAIDEFRIATE